MYAIMHHYDAVGQLLRVVWSRSRSRRLRYINVFIYVNCLWHHH